MREKDYITATNLAKLRMASTIVRDILPTTKKHEAMQKEIAVALREWTEYYEVALGHT